MTAHGEYGALGRQVSLGDRSLCSLQYLCMNTSRRSQRDVGIWLICLRTYFRDVYLIL